MADKHEVTDSDIDQNPKVKKWYEAYQIHHQDRYPVNPSKIILKDPDLKIENLDKKDFEQVFFWTMSQGVALSSAPNQVSSSILNPDLSPDPGSSPDRQPHFFYPKTFLKVTGRQVFRPRNNPPTPYSYFANGLNSIVLFKNLPENQNNPALQEAAKSAITEYLDPELFANNFTYNDDLFEIFQLLNSEALADQMIIDCFNAAVTHKQELDDINKEKSRARGRKTDYRHTYQPISKFEKFPIKPDSTIEEVLEHLKHSPNHLAFERINALKLWRDYILQELPDANLSECVRSFQPDLSIPKYQDRPESDTYSVIAFNYAGHRCMIAECCNDQNQSSAAMKVWRGELNDPNGWEQAFDQTKKAASQQQLCQDIRHTKLTSEVESRKTDDYQYIVDSENELFWIAIHYFKTGELLRNNETTSSKLAKLADSELSRPNFTPTSSLNP